jgi:polar amino acid transport system substrate-binding protein
MNANGYELKMFVIRFLVFAGLFSGLANFAAADALDDVQRRGELLWGGDAEGGGPYIYGDPTDPRRLIGFEVELADALARELGVKARFAQGLWDNLPALLATKHIDIVLNGYELTGSRAGRMAHTSPYYIYELTLLARRDKSRPSDWEDLERSFDNRKAAVGVLSGSGAEHYVRERFGDHVALVAYQGTTEAMREVETGRLDATVADLPAANFYRERFPALERRGAPAGRGQYVIYLRDGEPRLRTALDAALARLIASGELRRIYEHYGVWTEAQAELGQLAGKSDQELGVIASRLGGWAVLRERGWLLVESAGVTVALACAAMPLAMAIGLLVALGRLYGPAPLRWLLVAYVEILRGTPLMLQLFVIYYAPAEFGLAIPAWLAAIAGLAINYSAAEAENYRAGLQAIPRGQMEAALALGMSPGLALRRIIVPQAVRIVIPPVTNDFIALFKDTSVCSVITVIELTEQYRLQINDTGATLEIAALTAALYLSMSLPLAHLAGRMERRLALPKHSP